MAAHIGMDGNFRLRSTYVNLDAAGTLPGRSDSVTSHDLFGSHSMACDTVAGAVSLSLVRSDIVWASKVLIGNRGGGG